MPLYDISAEANEKSKCFRLWVAYDLCCNNLTILLSVKVVTHNALTNKWGYVKIKLDL